MAPVVAFAVKVATAAFAKVTFAAVAKFVITTALSIGVSRLLAKRALAKAQAGGDGGGRVQLPPATDNKIPVVYGSAFIGGPIVDAYLTPDQLTMYYVVALAEVTDNGTISYGDIYYDGKLVQFGSDGSGGTTKVTALINNSTTPSQSDTRVNGFINIYLYSNGSTGATSGTNTTQNAYDVFPGWGSSTYAMTDCAFAIIKVVYNRDAGTTGIGALSAQIKNTESGQSTGVYRPGTAIYDYLTNSRYGCAIPISNVDTASLTDLNTYSDQTITVTGGPSPTQARYRINGPLDTASNCLDNLQFLVDTCDSWLQYSELTGKWKVVINKAYTQTPNAQTLNDLFLVDSNNLVGGIEVSPIDLNETYNLVEVAYPNFNIKDQTDYQIIDLFDIAPNLLSQNEAVNKLNVTLPLVNNAVQAKYLAARRIYQSREDLVISFRTDYSGIQVEAGDVIRVTHEIYNWTDKLFRVSEVIEEKDGNGNLFATFRAFEYNADVYVDDPVADYSPEFDTGTQDPNIISQPGTPTIAAFTTSNALVTGFNVTSTSPANGIVLFMDFNYGSSSNVLQHRLYRTVEQSDSTPYTANTSVTIPVNDLPAGNYYWSTTARNLNAGTRSNSSTIFNWGGANIQPYDANSNTGGIGTSQIQNGAITTALIAAGAIGAAQIALGSLTYDLFDSNSVTPTQLIDLVGFEIADGIANTVTMPVDVASRTSFTEPFYITGTDPGANYIFPLYQGTATTANGYYANSTSAWNPGDADNFARQDGDWDWYTMIASSFSGNTYQPGEFLVLTTQTTFVANTNATIQISPVITSTVSPGDFIGTDDSTTTLNLITNQPTVFNQIIYIGATDEFNGAGYMIRNITNSSNVTVAFCQLTVERTTL